MLLLRKALSSQRKSVADCSLAQPQSQRVLTEVFALVSEDLLNFFQRTTVHDAIDNYFVYHSGVFLGLSETNRLINSAVQVLIY